MSRNGIHKYFFRACCAVCAMAIAAMGTALRAYPQAASNDLSFEVATVKPVSMDAPHHFDPSHFGVHVSPAGASYWSMTVGSLVAYAYGVESFQVTGPEWTTADRFDIEARFTEGAGKQDNRRMLQALLRNRFNLAFHIEKRPLEIYALIVGKHGNKLKPSLLERPTAESSASLKPGENSAGGGSGKATVVKNQDGSSTIDKGTRGTETVKFDQESWTQHFEFSKMTMEALAQRLSVCMASTYHKVVDETGIEGNYRVTYDCPLPGPRPPAGAGGDGTLPSDPQVGASLTGSLDALGLKLEQRKTPMDVYVIDHVERPSEN